MSDELERFRVGVVLDPKDEIDASILNHTLKMIIGLQLSSVFSDKEKHAAYFRYIMEAAQSLFKSNSHRRKYLHTEPIEIKSLFDSEIKKINQNVDVGFNPIELNAEVDGFLSHIKATLDSIAKSFDILFGIKTGGWNKKGEISGIKILNQLDNLPSDKKKRAQDLTNIIKDNVEWISYLVHLRDAPHHRGGIKSITDLVFDHKQKTVIPQLIIHPGSQPEMVRDFLIRTIKNIDIFIGDMIASSLMAIAFPGCVIVKSEQGFPPYSWAIIKSK